MFMPLCNCSTFKISIQNFIIIGLSSALDPELAHTLYYGPSLNSPKVPVTIIG